MLTASPALPVCFTTFSRQGPAVHLLEHEGQEQGKDPALKVSSWAQIPTPLLTSFRRAGLCLTLVSPSFPICKIEDTVSAFHVIIVRTELDTAMR